MDDFDSRPPEDELNFLGDLDRGMDGPPDPAASAALGHDSPPPPAPHVRRRPLLELFPPEPALDPPLAPPAPDPLPPPPRLAEPRIAEPRAALRAVRPPAAASDVLTYEIFYGLHESPFGASLDPKFLYHSAALDRLVQEVLTSIGRRDAMVAVTAPAGTGKTTLLRALLDQIDRRTFTSFVPEPFDNVDDLLKTILFDFGVITRADMGGGRLSNATRAELTFALHEFLLSLVQLNGFAVVFMDDAHLLSADMLEELRALADTDQPLMEIVLVGEPVLLETIDRCEEARRDRSRSLRLRLDRLADEEIGGYLSHRLAVAGSGQSRTEFDDDAAALIYDVSRGVPHVVNLIADRALALGFEDSASVIDAPIAERAARGLDLVAAEAPSARVLHKALAVAGLAALVLVGIAVGLFVFRGQVDRLVNSWATTVPASPPPPVIRMVEPIVVPPPLDLPPPPPVRR